MLVSKPKKVLFANVFCFIIIIIVVYQSEKYTVVNNVSRNNDNNIVVNGEKDEFEEISPVNLGIRSSLSPLMQNYQTKLCELDKKSVDKLKTFNVTVNKLFNSNKVTDYVNDFFQEFVQNPHRSFCTEKQRFGGEYNSNCKFTDGSKFVCMDDLLKDIENKECLIYSFGVAEDWSFEDIMDFSLC